MFISVRLASGILSVFLVDLLLAVGALEDVTTSGVVVHVATQADHSTTETDGSS